MLQGVRLDPVEGSSITNGVETLMDLRRLQDQLGRALRAVPVQVGDVKLTRRDSNPQTTLDLRTDVYLKRELASILDVAVISEEDRGAVSNLDVGLCWVVDPIDGTINAIAGTDDFAVSVALVKLPELTPLVGAVYLPSSDILYQAASGLGARRDDESLDAVLARRNMRSDGLRIASFGIPKDIPGVADKMSKALRALFASGWVTRQVGAASIDICRVASGSWSAFFEYRLMYWDFVAAVLIAREAGCHVLATPSEHRSGTVQMEYDLVVARTPAVLAEIAAAAEMDPQGTMTAI